MAGRAAKHDVKCIKDNKHLSNNWKEAGNSYLSCRQDET